jgi:putative endonuclease
MAKGKVGLGRRGETLTATALEQRGFRIVARNWHCAEGEVDLIARYAGEWYFVEVRTRRGSSYGSPEQSINPRKLARMGAVAQRYIGEHIAALDVVWHLSVAAVVMDRAGRVQRITFYPDLESTPLELSE